MPSPPPARTNNPPPISNTNPTPWLIVLLTKTPLPPEAHSYLEERLQPTYPQEAESFQKWTPTPSSLKYIAKQSAHIDSQANIYALAIKIHKTGRSRFIVVDELSRRQLTDTRHHGEAKQPTIVVITIYEDSNAHNANGVSVWARRDTCKKERVVRMFERSDLRREYMPVLVPGVDPSTEPVSERELWADPGIELHDPERGFLCENTRSALRNVSSAGAQGDGPMTMTGWDEHVQALRGCLWPRLPREIIDQIITDDTSSGAGVPGALASQNHTFFPMWRNLPSDDHLVIFLLFPTTETDFHRTEQLVRSGLERNVPRTSFELIRWEEHRLQSRRDIMSFWIEYHRYCISFRKTGYPPLHLLLEPITDLSTPSFIEITSRYRSVATASRTTLGKIMCTRGDRLRILHYPALQKENISHPDLPFCYTAAPWQTAGEWSRLWIPAFYLTSQIAEEEDVEIRKEIKRWFSRMDGRTWYNKECGFVGWDHDRDGDVEDIWGIVQRVHAEGFFGRGYEIFICIDFQSSLDGTVILVVPQYWNPMKRWSKLKNIPFPGLVGFIYARMPGRMAHLESCDIKFDEVGPEHEFKRFRRSDVPTTSDFFDNLDEYSGASNIGGCIV